MNKLFRFFVLVLSIVLVQNLNAQLDEDNSVIVSGFVLNSSTAEGVTANITIKNAETYKVVTIIPTANLSGSYTFRLSKGRYYFIIETPGFDMLNELVDLDAVSSKRVQKDLVLVPSGSKKTSKVVELNDSTEAKMVVDPVSTGNSESNEIESPVETLQPSGEIEQSNDERSDKIEVETVKPGTEGVENGRRVIYGIPIQDDGSVREDLEDVAPSKNTQVVEDRYEGRESKLNYTIKQQCQFLDIQMNFAKNDSRIESVQEQLQLVLSFLKQNPDVTIEIRGFAEDGFETAMDKNVALQRATNSKKFFMQNGVDPNRVKAVAYPTSDLEKYVKSKREFRRNHLVEFRLRKDDLFESEYKMKYSEEYGAYKAAGGTEPANDSNSGSKSNDNKGGIINGVNSDNDNISSSSTNNSDNDNNSTPGSGISNTDILDFLGTDSDVTDNNSSNSSSGTNSNTGESTSNMNGGTSSLNIRTEGGDGDENSSVNSNVTSGSENNGNVGNSGVNIDGSKSNVQADGRYIDENGVRRYPNGLAISGESADYKFTDSDYDPEKTETDGDRILAAIEMINSKIEEIESKVIYFEPKLAEVDEGRYKSVLDSLYVFLSTNRRYDLKIFGYASKKGDKKEAAILPKNRAQNVAHILQDKGILKKRVKFQGVGLFNTKNPEGLKVDTEKEMCVRFEVIKPDLSAYEKTIKKDNSSGRQNNAGANAGNQGQAGGGVVLKDYGNEPVKPEMPEFATEQEYIDYLKNNQGTGVVKDLFFRVQVGAFKLPLNPKDKLLKSSKEIVMLEGADGWYRYVTNKYSNINEAYEELKKIKKKVSDAFVLAFYNDQKITMKEATRMILNAK